MNAQPTSDELAKRFGFEPVPENVQRLTKLVSNQEASLDDVARLICQDTAMAARLLRAANPNAGKKEEYEVTTVEAALRRNGIGAALLLAMSDPLIRAVAKMFQTMLASVAVMVPVKLTPPIDGEHVMGQVSFSGKAKGSVFLRLTSDSACWVAGRILGTPKELMTDPSEINDVVAELANIVVGNFKSNLCDAGLDCKLTPPTILRTSDFRLKVIAGGLAERIVFRNRDVTLFVDINVNPWNDA